jgi:hypothetical protein
MIRMLGGSLADMCVSLADICERLAVRISPDVMRSSQRRRLPRNTRPSRLGQLLICLFVPVDRQQDRLGDFEEKFNTLWLPRFGRRLAQIIYIIHAIRLGAAVLRIAAVAAIVDRVVRALGG